MPSPLPPLVSLETFLLWPGILIDDEQTDSARYVLTAASAYVRSESGDDSRWSDADSIPAAIATVTVQVAARVWRNPDCVMRVDTGPFTEMFQRSVDDALFITDNERKMIGRTIKRPKLWSQGTWRDRVSPFDDIYLVPTPGYTDPMALDVWGNEPWVLNGPGSSDCDDDRQFDEPMYTQGDTCP